MTPEAIAAVLAEVASIWKGSPEMPAVRSAVSEFRKALMIEAAEAIETKHEFYFDADAFTAACHLDD